MDMSTATVQALASPGLMGKLEDCIARHTDHIVITNASYAGIDPAKSRTPRYAVNKALLEKREDFSMLGMNKAYVRSKLTQCPNAYGWISREHTTELGSRVAKSGLADCDLCAAAVVWALGQCPDLAGLTVEVFGTGGHAYVVVNRDPASTGNEPTTWGNACFVIDIWSHNQGISSARVMTVNEYASMFPDGLPANRLM